MNTLQIATLALLIDMGFGFPAFVQKAIGHPVEWIGKALTYLDEGLNDDKATPGQNKFNGVLALAALLVITVVPAIAIQYVLLHISGGWIVSTLMASTFLAQRSLGQHVQDVAMALPRSLQEAREAVAKIVGRDPNTLDQTGVAKAALESLAENTSDGVVAPFIWLGLLGLPGLVAYKAINTADSMIGHKSEKYLHFGWAAARLDDLVNLPASRLTGLLFIMAARLRGNAGLTSTWAAMRRDAPKHQSPNAGWPEAAMAGALGLTFGGKRSYDGQEIALPTMGDGRQPEGAEDINAGLDLYAKASWILVIGAGLLASAL